MSVFSQATNTNHFPNSGINPRTGTYNHSIPIVKITSSDPNEDLSREIKLSYSALAALNTTSSVPFGCGWSLNGVTTYDAIAQKITLSNGEQYSHDGMEATNIFSFNDRKTRNFAVERISDDKLRVYYKDGIVEELNENAGSIFQTTLMFFPNGEYYIFNYTSVPNSSGEHLSNVVNAKNVKVVQLNYDNYLNTATIWDASATAVFNITNDSHGETMNSYSRFVDDNFSGSVPQVKLTYEFDTSTNYFFLNMAEFPEGVTEVISKHDTDHKHKTSSGGIAYVPRVGTYQAIDARTEKFSSHEKYEYGIDEVLEQKPEDANFLGYPNRYDWKDHTDNLYEWGDQGQYAYGVTVTTAVGTDDETVKQTTYNTFHLTVKEVAVSKNCEIETEYTYPCHEEGNTTKIYEDLPANLLFPTLIKRTLKQLDEEGNSQAEKSYLSYSQTDDCGNQTWSKSPSGAEEKAEYFPAEGDSEKCPADPLGQFIRFTKTKTTSAESGTPFRKKDFQYESFVPYDGISGYITHVVKPCKIIVGDDNCDAFATVDLTYLSSPEMLFTHNKLQQGTLTINSIGSDESQSTACTMTYTELPLGLKKDRTITGYDGEKFSTSETHTYYTDLITERIDRDGSVSTATYDGTGKVLSNTTAVSTDFEETMVYEHKFFDSTYKGPTVTRTDAFGVKNLICYDGFGNIVAAAANPRGTTDPTVFLEFFSQSFDLLGRIAADSHSDYDSEDNIFSVTSSKKYDGWGHICEESTSDGVTIKIVNDPINLKTTRVMQLTDDAAGTQEQDQASFVTTYNLFQKAVDKQVVPTSDEPYSTSYSYDGIGRLTSVLSSLSAKMSITGYDPLSRVVNVTNADESAYNIAYASFSPKKNDVESITISGATSSGNVVLGSREYDGIGRITKTTVAGCNTEFGYSAGKALPAQVKTGREHYIGMEYTDGLSKLPSSIGTWLNEPFSEENAQSFDKFVYGTSTEDGSLGRLVSASNKDSTSQMDYTTSGQKKTIKSVVVGGKTGTVTYNKVTLRGKPLEVEVDIGGMSSVLTYKYDENGRMDTVSQSGYKVQMSYDSYGRPNKEEITDSSGAIVQKTELAWDDLSREKSRIITTNIGDSSEKSKIEYGYDNGDKMTSRTLYVNDVSRLSESFTYDVMKRLAKYVINSGYDSNFLPGSEVEDRRMIGQEFTYDVCNNIKTVITTLDDGSSDTATWAYPNMGERRPSAVSHTSPSYPSKICFTYDAEGNLTKLSASEDTELEYSVSGRVTKYKNGDVTKSYQYDPFQRLLKDGDSTKFYHDNLLFYEDAEVSGTSVEFIRVGARPLVEKEEKVDRILGLDKNLSVISSTASNIVSHTSYSPYGMGSGTARTGFAGETRGTHGYLNGNGTRLYVPEMNMFLSMDSFSPFSGGGIHPLLYCEGDPINAIDPSGHMSSGADLGLNIFALLVDAVVLALAIPTGGASIAACVAVTSAVLGITSDVLGIASDSIKIQDEKTGNDRSEAAQGIGFASSIFAVASLATGMGASAGETFSSKSYTVTKGKAFENSAKELSKCEGKSLSRSVAGDVGSGGYKLAQPAGVTSFSSVIEAEDVATSASAMARSGIESVTGIDFRHLGKMMNTENAAVKRARSGIWASAQFANQMAGYELLANGTWSVGVSNEEDIQGMSPVAAADDGSVPAVLAMVNQKYKVA